MDSVWRSRPWLLLRATGCAATDSTCGMATSTSTSIRGLGLDVFRRLADHRDFATTSMQATSIWHRYIRILDLHRRPHALHIAEPRTTRVLLPAVAFPLRSSTSRRLICEKSQILSLSGSRNILKLKYRPGGVPIPSCRQTAAIWTIWVHLATLGNTMRLPKFGCDITAHRDDDEAQHNFDAPRSLWLVAPL
jgi:hypothetical protein